LISIVSIKFKDLYFERNFHKQLTKIPIAICVSLDLGRIHKVIVYVGAANE